MRHRPGLSILETIQLSSDRGLQGVLVFFPLLLGGGVRGMVVVVLLAFMFPLPQLPLLVVFLVAVVVELGDNLD